MTTTMRFGTFCNAGAELDDLTIGVEQTIGEALGENADMFNVEELIKAYRARINELLDGTGVSLVGNDFFGPAAPTPSEMEAMAAVMARVDDDRELTIIGAAVMLAGEEFWELARQHER